MIKSVLTLTVVAFSLMSQGVFAHNNPPWGDQYHPRFGDENDTSWLPGSKVTEHGSAARGSSATMTRTEAPKQTVRFGDENDTSWLPAPHGNRERSATGR